MTAIRPRPLVFAYALFFSDAFCRRSALCTGHPPRRSGGRGGRRAFPAAFHARRPGEQPLRQGIHRFRRADRALTRAPPSWCAWPDPRARRPFWTCRSITAMRISAAISPELPGKATYSLIDVATGTAKVKGAEEANNRDREKLVDRDGLGREIGALVAARVVTALGGGKAAN